MKLPWRFFLGAAIGAGLGYAAVLLARPTPAKLPRFRTIYQAPREDRQEQPAA